MKPLRVALLVIGLAVGGWLLFQPAEDDRSAQPAGTERRPVAALLARPAPQRRTPASTGARTAIDGAPNDARADRADTDATQRHLASVYGKDRLEEAGATQTALYSSRAHHQWLSIGAALHRGGQKALATEVAGFIGLLKSAMQPFAPVTLGELLEAERGLLAKVREPRVLKLAVRGGGRTSIGEALDRVERGNRAASRGDGPSVARKIEEIEDEAAANESVVQADRKPWRSWSHDPAELQEEMADRRMPRPVDEDDGVHGLEMPTTPVPPPDIPDAAIPEL